MTNIHISSLEDVDFDGFKETVEKNLLSKKEIAGKNKGAYQILQQLIKLFDSKNYNEITGILKIKNIKKLNIYPILLMSDTNYNILSTNTFVNERCSSDFIDIKDNFQSVKPILILNVNTLIEYYSYFKRSKTNFTDLVTGYFKEISKQKQKYNSGKDIYSYLMSSISFDSYVQRKLKSESFIQNFKSFSNDFATELSGIDFTPPQLKSK